MSMSRWLLVDRSKLKNEQSMDAEAAVTLDVNFINPQVNYVAITFRALQLSCICSPRHTRSTSARFEYPWHPAP